MMFITVWYSGAGRDTDGVIDHPDYNQTPVMTGSDSMPDPLPCSPWMPAAQCLRGNWASPARTRPPCSGCWRRPCVPTDHARAVPLPEDRRRCTSHSGRLPGQAQPPARPAGRRGRVREGPPASHAPLVIVVVASPRPDPKVPEQEQLMTAGCVCFAAAGRAGAWLRRTVADGLDGLRSGRAGPPGPGRG